MEKQSDITVQTESGMQVIKNIQEFTAILNTEPNPKKVQKYRGYEYIPISIIEKDLDAMFNGLVQYECISYSHIFNEVTAHARIKVFHPIINQWLNYDGLGSAVIQQDADTKVIDFMNFKKPNALQLTLPKAFAEGIKNAAKKIGKRFGADLNRVFEDEYAPFDFAEEVKARQEAKLPVSLEVEAEITIAETTEQLAAIYKAYPNLHSNPDFMKRLTARKEVIVGK